MPAHMTFVRVIDVRVDSSLKDVLEVFRFGMLSISQPGEMDILEGRAVWQAIQRENFMYSEDAALHVTQIEQTCVQLTNSRSAPVNRRSRHNAYICA